MRKFFEREGWVGKSMIFELEEWQLALIIVFVILIIGGIIALVVWMLMNKKKSEATGPDFEKLKKDEMEIEDKKRAEMGDGEDGEDGDDKD